MFEILSLPLRPMVEEDLAAVMQIELRAYSHPWTHGIFSDCLRHRYPCFVYQPDRDIEAYVVLMQSLEELHILNITVLPERQRQGLGRQLLNAVEKIGLGLSASECFLEVRASNQAAINLYLKQGFNEIGLRKNYYPTQQGREHALLMAKTLFPPD
ncbi:ribosomal protein S18-alanine N-acetyltransferase [Thiolinea disciformis]|uniref:ribosomal protein S18-alanine N-acetyltransferase n=1 Tax=Thiolinea disciformis TaxID=125614 RepID=UPI00036E5A30|nr:ribosomal protein S18-alanine N-acetyltransferase [Thiolinea disciformis]